MLERVKVKLGEERKRRPKSGQGEKKRIPGLRGKPTGLRGLLAETFPGEETFHNCDFYFEIFKFCLMFNFATLTQ